MKKAIQNATRQKKFRHERKRKLECTDETTRKKLMGKVMSTRKMIRPVETLNQLTEALNREGFELKRSSVYLQRTYACYAL